MDEIYTLSQYFPSSSSDPTLEKYLSHHLGACLKCSEHELYSSAYSHLHILYMIFVYVQLFRIAKEKTQEFDLCWVGFPNQEKDFLKEPSSPFSFSKIQEKTVFRFFRLVGFDDGSIGDISSLVNKRNNHLHANGQLFFENQDDFEKEIDEYIKKMQTIITKQADFLQTIYSSLVAGYEEGFEITQDEIETNFADQYYFSEYELKCLAKDKDDIVSKFIIDKM
jgi:hypothetical protein